MSRLEPQIDPAAAPVDARVDSPQREGLTGTTPADAYVASPDPEQVTRPPDGRPMEAQPQWRRDFPIDWPQDHYVARRDFAKFMVVTSAAFVVGQVCIGMKSVWRRGQGVLPERKIASLSSLPVGATLVFQYPYEHDDCILIRTGPDKLLAYSQKCTHLSCAVIPKVEEGVIRCPCHEGVFDLYSGRNIAGPPPRPLPPYVVSVRGEKIVVSRTA